MNLKQRLIKQSLLVPTKPAIIFNEQKITFSQLKNLSFKFANHLLAMGIAKFDKIAVYLPNTPETVMGDLGILSIGASLVPLDFMLTEKEIINLINHSEAKILITQPKREINLENIKNSCSALREIVVCTEGGGDFSFGNGDGEKNREIEPLEEINDDDLCSIFYTSGSTGHPKGVMLNFKHLDNPVECIEYCFGISSQDINICAGLPLSHIGGFDAILLMLYRGSTLVLMDRFNPLELLKKIEKYRVTLMWLVPSMYVAILSLKDYSIFDLSSLRYMTVFGAPSSPVLMRKFHKICPNAYLLNGWGMTETAAPNCVLPLGVEKIESIGKFAPWMEAKVVDEQGNSLGPQEQGELWVKGKAVMVGYYKEPGLTKEVMTEDGWFKTGDIAKFDEQNLFYIVGRKKDVIKVAGEIVFSPELEETIQRHPKVKEVAVIGVADKLRGEVPKALVVLGEKEVLKKQDLINFLKENLAHFKIPHYFEFVAELPKTRTGKIDKGALALKKVAP